MRLIQSAAILIALSVGSAHAATLTPVQGEVLLNTGAGYKPVSGAVEVKAGDAVLVNPKGLAQLSYGDCASYEIKPGDVVYVAEKEAITCVGAAGAGAGALGLGALGGSGLIVGGLAVAVGVGVVAGVSSGSDSPSSP